MRKIKFPVALLLIFFLLTASIPVAAGERGFSSAGASGDRSRETITTVAVVTVVVAVGLLIRSAARNSKAKGFYRQGEDYAAQGRWDLAADAFAEAAKINPKYRDVKSKLAYAREQAEKMLIALGDEAREKEKLEDALHYYQKALKYQPDSVLARARLEDLGRQMVAVYYRRGQVYETQNRWEEALREYEQAYHIDPYYEDLSDRYLRAKVKVEGEQRLLGVLYFLNYSDYPGLEAFLLQAVHAELAAAGAHRYVVIDYRRVQSIIGEQAEALGERFDDSLAMDMGRLLGADAVLTGEIRAVSQQGRRIRIQVAAKILAVPGAKVLKEVELSHTFSRKMTMDDLPEVMPEVAQELAKKILQ
ncbi:MAG TPA: tetratricopeptide repeat protein [Firmicutes bacterium]|jgi:tetratricopeptide (TPR) repeat protein|nr:tetratricopeptide repeat protein [Bacillota bacterium]